MFNVLGYELTQDQVDLLMNGVSTDTSGYKVFREGVDDLVSKGIITVNGPLYSCTELGWKIREELKSQDVKAAYIERKQIRGF